MSRTSAAVLGLPLLAGTLVAGVPTIDAFGSFTSSWQDGLSVAFKIVSFLAIAIYLIVKFEIIVLVSVQEGTVAIRTSWGRPRFYRSNHKADREGHRRDKGRLVVLYPGRHLMIKGLHGLVIVNLREEVLEMPSREITFKKRTLHLKGLTVTWRTVYDDSPEGDQCLINRVWFVADIDVTDKSVKRYEHKLVAILEKAMSDGMSETKTDDEGFPVFVVEDLTRLALESIAESKAQLVDGEFKKFILPEITDVYVPPLAWTEAQIEKDAKIRAAKILAGVPDDEADGLESSHNPETPTQPRLQLAAGAEISGIT